MTKSMVHSFWTSEENGLRLKRVFCCWLLTPGSPFVPFRALAPPNHIPPQPLPLQFLLHSFALSSHLSTTFSYCTTVLLLLLLSLPSIRRVLSSIPPSPTTSAPFVLLLLSSSFLSSSISCLLHPSASVSPHNFSSCSFTGSMPS